MTFEHVPDILVAVARPGDTVIIAFRGNLDDQDIESIEASFRPIIDDGIKVAFTDQVESMVVCKAASDDDINDWGGE